MNLHLAQITSLPFHFDAATHSGATHGSAADILGVDTKRPVTSRALGRRIARMVAWLMNAPRRARERDEMARLSERELADIGLTSGDVGRIHDPAFAADHAAGRAMRTSIQWL